MRHQLTIQVNNKSISVERFLRVVRHRGFELVTMSLTSFDDHYKVNIEVESDRPLHLLTQQLIKLVDIELVEIVEMNQQNALA